jgi:hypothetical protein
MADEPLSPAAHVLGVMHDRSGGDGSENDQQGREHDSLLLPSAQTVERSLRTEAAKRYRGGRELHQRQRAALLLARPVASVLARMPRAPLAATVFTAAAFKMGDDASAKVNERVVS